VQPATSFPPQDGSGQGGVGELMDFALGFLLRQYLVILLLVLLAGVAGAIFLVVTPPTYTAQAKIFIGTQKAEFVQQQSLFAEAPIDNAQIETQIEILLSKAIVASVVQKLKLGDDPEFASPPVGLISWVLQVFNNPTAAEPKLDTEIAIARLAIGVSSRSPEKSAQIANAVADAYIEDQQEVKRQANRIASKWLQERLRELSGQSAAADQAVVEFKQQNNIVSAAGKRMDEQNLADLNTRLVDARTHTSDVLARLTQIESIIRSWDPKATLDASVSDELSNTILTNLRQQYLELAPGAARQLQKCPTRQRGPDPSSRPCQPV
jgi:succinoglycan biosynthesis transport protein ExoP